MLGGFSIIAITWIFKY